VTKVARLHYCIQYWEPTFRISSINYYLVCNALIHKICTSCGVFSAICVLLTTETMMTLKSVFQIGEGQWKLYHWITHVSFPISY